MMINYQIDLSISTISVGLRKHTWRCWCCNQLLPSKAPVQQRWPCCQARPCLLGHKPVRSCILEDFGDGDSRLMRFWLFQENHQIRENPSIQIIYTHILKPLLDIQSSISWIFTSKQHHIIFMSSNPPKNRTAIHHSFSKIWTCHNFFYVLKDAMNNHMEGILWSFNSFTRSDIHFGGGSSTGRRHPGGKWAAGLCGQAGNQLPEQLRLVLSNIFWHDMIIPTYFDMIWLYVECFYRYMIYDSLCGVNKSVAPGELGNWRPLCSAEISLWSQQRHRISVELSEMFFDLWVDHVLFPVGNDGIPNRPCIFLRTWLIWLIHKTLQNGPLKLNV